MPLVDLRPGSGTSGAVNTVNGVAPVAGNITITAASLGASGKITNHIYTLILADITAKQITLPSTPVAPTKVDMDVIGGIKQKYGTDFTVAANVLSWNTLGYQALAEVGDELIITYEI